MGDSGWTPLFRTPKSTTTAALRSPAFRRSRAWASLHVGDQGSLRKLAGLVDDMDHESPPLSAVADRVTAAVRLVRATADRLECAGTSAVSSQTQSPAGEPRTGAAELPVTETASTAARQRLLIAALHYLVTPIDLVPDFRPGGYIDDVLLLSWVFGAAAHELEPYLDNPSGEATANG